MSNQTYIDACKYGHESRLKSGLQKKEDPLDANMEVLDPDQADHAGWRLIHYASGNGRLNIVKCLVKHGANINAKDHTGKQPVHIACRNGHKDVLKYLLSKNGNASCEDKDGEKPIHKAIRGGNKDIIAHLLKCKAGVTIQDTRYDKWQSIHIASEDGSKEMVDLCITKGADINAETADGRTALDIASDARQSEVEMFLRGKGGKEGTHKDQGQPEQASHTDGKANNNSASVEEGLVKKEEVDNIRMQPGMYNYLH